MTLGRFGGDRIKQAVGGRAILIFGGLLGAAGFVLAVFVPSWLASLAGFWMVGLGASNIVPVLYSALGRQRIMPPNLAVSAVTTVGYLGILAGPALIGLTAHATSLSDRLPLRRRLAAAGGGELAAGDALICYGSRGRGRVPVRRRA